MTERLTRGREERGRRREPESGKSGEKRPGGLGGDCRRRRYPPRPLCSLFLFWLFQPQTEYFLGSKVVLCTNTPPFSGPALVSQGGGGEESRMNQWPFERSASGCPAAEPDRRDPDRVCFKGEGRKKKKRKKNLNCAFEIHWLEFGWRQVWTADKPRRKWEPRALDRAWFVKKKKKKKGW